MDIYEPAEDSYLLQKHVKRHVWGRVLDVGTGSGIQALTAIKNHDVKEVIAVDINENATNKLNGEIKKQNLRKIKAIQSDLFENVDNHFNVIIFNPPYLSQDKGIDDPALYGGKHGWEISERFFKEVSKFLFHNGTILFLFSSLTNKKKINEIISHNLFEFEQLESVKLPFFEELFVYEIKKNSLLKKLENRGVENVHYLTRGKRGNIFIGTLDRGKLIKTHFAKKDIVKVGIKVKREESNAQECIKNEAYWLKILNRENIGPKLLFYTDEFVVYKFAEGEFILGWIKTKTKEEIKEVLSDLLQQCYVMDELKVNKEEMHHPLKHIVINKNNKPTLLDFERCHKTDKPQNVTQFVEFICRLKKELGDKGFLIDIDVLRNLAKNYKESSRNFDKIIKNLK